MCCQLHSYIYISEAMTQLLILWLTYDMNMEQCTLRKTHENRHSIIKELQKTQPSKAS